MFGKNPIRKQEVTDGLVLWVQEVFPTIQGEGPLSGTPAIFVRLGGCNLACTFCDTDFETSVWHPSVDLLVNKVASFTAKETLVVLTGGEPFRQNVGPLIDRLNSRGYCVQVETAGTLSPIEWSTGDDQNTIVCSPKTPKINRNIRELTDYWKYIIKAGEVSDMDGLPTHSTQEEGRRDWGMPARPDKDTSLDRIFVQPCDAYNPEQNIRNVAAAVDSARTYGYRLSLQLHKILELP